MSLKPSLVKASRLLAVIPLAVLSAVLLLSCFQLPLAARANSKMYFLFGVTFLIAGVVFSGLCQFSGFYVFGHEITHWMVAKLFRRPTGKVRLGMHSGYVEVVNANVWIILAPYIFPFYFFLALGLTGLLDLFFTSLPTWTKIALPILYAVTLAYHYVMTAISIAHGQSDLERCGTTFSLALIITGNLLLTYLGLILMTNQWTLGWHNFWGNITDIFQICWNFIHRTLFVHFASP